MSSPVRIDGSNPDHVKMLINDLDETYKAIVLSLETDLENKKKNQEETISTGLAKLPKPVRSMTIKDFNSQYSCDLLPLMKSKVDVQVAVAAVAASATDDVAGAVMETPVRLPRRQDMDMATPARSARRGERLFSQNGSPIETTHDETVVATVKRVTNGLQNLESEMPEPALFLSLQELQKQLASLMAKMP